MNGIIASRLLAENDMIGSPKQIVYMNMKHPSVLYRWNLWFCATLCGVLMILNVSARAAEEPQSPLRAGMIGLDTSHVPAFAKIFNNSKEGGELSGLRVVAGYPGGTDIPASRDRVGKFTEELRGMGIEIVDTIPKLLEKV